jgi:sugar (pentulose or hexulose) kinase
LYGCLEGVTLRLGAVIDLISTVCRDKQWKTSGDNEGHQPIIVVSGNALEQNIIWRQMIADCTGFGVVVDSDSSEGTSRGVAMLLARTIQDIGQREEKISILSESRPIGETKSKWDYASLNQEDLIQAVSITWNR